MQSYEGGQVEVELGEELTAGLKELSRRHGTTLFMTVLAGWAVLLSRLSGQEEVVIGTPVANRGRSEIEGLIGFFVNTLAIRVDVSGSPSAAALLKRVRERVLAGQTNQDVPFEQVVEALKPERTLAHSPVFQVMLAWQNLPQTGGVPLEGLRIEGMGVAGSTSQFDLTLSLMEADGRVVGSLVYAAALFERSTIERYLNYWKRLLEGMVAGEEVGVDRLEWLPEPEIQLLLKEWNRTEAEYPSERCIHELFEEQVRRTPEAAAVVYEEVTLSYEELNARANRLAHYLREQGVEPDTRVGICVERGPEMVVGLLAILKAGGAYVPLDPAYPRQRLGYLLSDSAPVLLLVDESGMQALAGQSLSMAVVDLKADAQRWSQCPSRDLSAQEIGLRSDHLAYVIYTSGSTGEPKGVMVEHRQVVNFWFSLERFYRRQSSCQRVALNASITFDASVQQFVQLLSGRTLLVVPQTVRRDARMLLKFMEDNEIEEIDCTPSQLESWVACGLLTGWHGLRVVLVGGESVGEALWGKMARCDEVDFYNVYGPSECTVDATAALLRDRPDMPNIGRPITNTRIYILDANRQPVPVGVRGEIYIGGAGLARGYLNRPELTAERFVADPFRAEAGARMYRTGDLARYRADGNIEFLGRNDDQVKVRGYRIELGEIESQLRAYPGIREAVVVAREEEGGSKRLVGYYVAEAGEEPRAETLRAHLRERLPEYMVPAALMSLEAIPLTANGKLDRKGLPAPEAEAYARAQYEEPRGEVEVALAQIWQQLLNVERVGRGDNFFELGGHSLMAVTLIARMRQRGLRTDVRALFGTPRLGELAKQVSREEAAVEVPESRIPVGCQRITPQMLPLTNLTESEIDEIVAQVPGGAGNVQDIYPLAPMQEGILFHHLMSEQGDTYLTPVVLSFATRERLERFVSALRAVIGRHDILRTGVMWEGLSEPVQVVWRQAPLVVEEVEFGEGDAASRLRERFDPRHYRLDVRKAPLMRVVIAQDRAQGRWLLLHLAHHLALDHTTLQVVFGEVQAYLLGRQARLKAPMPFRNFVFQARRGVSAQEHEEFFRGMLADIEEPTAPFGWLDVQGDGSGIAEARVPLDAELSRRIRERARAAGVSAASLCHLAWGQVLARLTGREEVVFGTVLFGRLQGGNGVEEAVGLFINTLPLRLSIGEQAAKDALRATHEQLGQLLRHEHASLAQAQRCSAVAAPLPLFTTLLNYRYNQAPQDGAEQQQAWEGVSVLTGEERTNYPLTLSVDDLGDGFGLTAQVRVQQSPERICALMSEALSGLVEALERAPERPIRAVEVLPGTERERLLKEWNRTEAEYPAKRCIHELFEEQVRRTPEAAAVVYEEVTLSYGELNARANRLAHYLREQGVQPDTRVGICVERGPEMVIGLLAVLKAGGAYVPLDPDYPSQRLGYLLSDSAPVLLLVDEAGREALAGQPLEMPVVDLKADAQRWAACGSGDLSAEEIGLRSDHLAYVIYTSGSTGEPKGVMVEHRGVCNLALAQMRTFGVGADSRVLQFASISFDACTFELVLALCRGAALHLVTSEGVLAGEALERVLKERRITHVTLPPAVLPGLGDPEELSGVGTVICAGEALPGVQARRWAANRALFNAYGPTEATVWVSVYRCEGEEQSEPPIGRPIANTKIYILDAQRRPVPIGVAGEIYIGGVGVARGYLNRPELTAQRFEADPFSTDRQARVYRTGDLGRYRTDGNIEFLGRNDDQVKVRGYRIELGEIEAQLRAHAGVREAVVVAREEEGGGKRLVGYYVPEGGEEPETESLRESLKESLREHLKGRLPEYMVPAALVRLEALPLTANGKLDRRALPAPEGEAYVHGEFEEPRGEVEIALAEIWQQLLKVERVGREDNFFELGGHSLLAVTLIEQMRRKGLRTDVRALFSAPTLRELAEEVSGEEAALAVPESCIPAGCERIRPQMLPLINLTESEIDGIVAQVPGGVGNVQDIYPLAPLQEGILFHHLMSEQGDTYLTPALLAFDSRERLDRFVSALQMVIERHDILRTAVMWEGLSEPVQVVWRQAPLAVEEVALGEGDAALELRERFDPRHYRLDVRRAPLMRAVIAHDRAQKRWLLLHFAHHLALDHTALEVVFGEVQEYLLGQQNRLQAPVPFRNFVFRARRGVSAQEHEEFFRGMLEDIAEPTAPFGWLDVQGDGSGIAEARVLLEERLSRRIRERARAAGVSAASLCHLAWAQVLSRLTGSAEVVFGTVLFGRLQGGEGAEQGVGLFINTLPLRVSIGEQGARDALRATHERLGQLLRHEHASLALAQRCSAVATPLPLFTTLLNYRYSRALPGDRERPRTWDEMKVLGAEERTNYPLTLSVDDLGERFGLTAQIRAQQSPQRICALMSEALKGLVEALERAPERPIHIVEVLPAQERERVLREWNRTDAEYPSQRCIHELFEEQVCRAPDAVALRHDAGTLGYAELNALANRLAHYLRELGVGPDKRVGICVERGPEMIVGLLAILKAGGAYVPLDPHYPRQRLEYLLADSAPVLLLVDQAGGEALANSPLAIQVLDLNADAKCWAHHSSRDVPAEAAGLRSIHLAYVIYTSGSTGEPKGVMVEHRSLANLARWHSLAFEVREGSRTSSVAALAFDAAAWEIWAALCAGSTLVLAPRQVSKDVEDLLSWWAGAELDASFLPTPIAEYVLSGNRIPKGLRVLLVGGDRLSRRPTDDSFRLINNYGPTECTVVATSGQVCKEDEVHIGRPIANTKIYLLDDRRRPVPIGAVGEIYIGGVGVARGYLNRPQLTAERFLADPFSGKAGPRMYRTGDLGRYRADGNIEFLGRNDDQVKVRGYRIELGEIESQLRAHAGVREAVVVAREEKGGGKRLVGYYVPEAGEEPETESLRESLKESLREHLKERLPEYMVPVSLMRLQSLPLTSNGKLDRRALPEPEQAAYERGEYQEPRGEVECALAEIWRQLLDVGRVGRQDNFFELGGHSLLAVTLIERMRQRGLRTDVRALFGTPRLWELAEQVSREGAAVAVPESRVPEGCERITPEMLPLVELEQSEIDEIVSRVPGGAANVQDIYPLSPLQEGILFHHLMSERGDAYLLPSLLAFDSRDRLDRFVSALQAVVERHDILRTGVMWERLSEPVQVVWRQAPLVVEEVELGEGDAASQLRERFDPRQYRLDVRRAPLMRVVIAHDRVQGRWLLVQLVHHLAIDHTALEVVFGEVQAYLLGEETRLGAPVPFRNFVFQARRGVSVKEQEEFFRGMLKDIEEPTAPFGWLDVQGDGSGIAEARVLLEEGLSRRIRERARAAGVSAASVCHLAWGQVLSRLTGREEVVFGTVLFGRLQGGEGVEQGVGLFINTLPLRVSIGRQEARDALRITHERLGQLLRHEHASLALAQRCSAVAMPLPVFTTLLNYRYTRARQGDAERRRAREGMKVLSGEERTNYPLALSVDDLGEGFGLTAQIRAQQSPERICRLMSEALSGLVEALERAPEMPIGAVEVLPGQERERVLREWNRTEAEYPSQRCIHELFEEQVRRTPEAAAVVYEEVTLSYEELNARANRLAHYLREQGVEPDTRVGLCVERGPEMVIGLLAVLKAGGAYVPLDPDYPSQRLGYLLSDSAPVLLLVDEAGREALAGRPAELSVVHLKADAQSWAACGSGDLSAEEIGLRSDHLAYVIYTSGSTGEPKGVMVEHRGVCNLALAQIGAFGVEADSRVLQFASISFDACVSEVMMALCCGAALHVVGKKSALMGEALARVLEERRITHVTLPPAVLPGLGEAGQLSGVGTLICAGEALPRELARRWSAGRRLLNAYGPTEATVCASVHHCHEQEQGEPPIGRPIANTKIYILDAQRRPVPIGVAGEIYIGGVGVARGYLNRPELTAQRFVADPFSAGAGARMYRTGDLGRYRTDGNIEFLGRNDDQVKVRGYRIELGEIEAQLRAHAGVREAVVVAREDEGSQKRLVGYYIAEAGEEPEVASLREDLKEHLRKRLPEYMVPAALVRLEALPLTANGKLDRKALPAPEAEAYAHEDYEEPRGEVEVAVAQIWQQLLRVDRVGRQDNFFELGGHSLLAVTLIGRVLQVFGVEVSVQAVFQRPRLAALAQEIEHGVVQSVPAMERADRDGELELSFTQQRLWFLTQLDERASRAYHMVLGLRLRGPLRRDALKAALDRIVYRHESLRTIFVASDGVARQRILPAEVGFALEETDLSAVADGAVVAGVQDGANGEAIEQRLRELAGQEARVEFDLTCGPLIRGHLVKVSEQEHVLLLTMHHIVSDGWSMGVLVRELTALYGAYRDGRADPLPPLQTQYADYAQWQRRWLQGERLQGQIEYWQSTLSGAPQLLSLPSDHPRPAVQSYEGGQVEVELGEELTAGLKELSRRHGTTLFMTVLAGWAVLLSRLSGQEEVVIGTPVANRGRSEIEGLIGFFVNTLAIRVDVSGSPSAAALLKRVRERVLAGQTNQDVPFEQVVEALKPERTLAHSPVFQVMLAWQNLPQTGGVPLEGLRIEGMGVAGSTSQFDLTLSLMEADGRVVGSLVYATALYERSTIERYLNYWKRLLEGMVGGEEVGVDRLEWLPEPEIQLLLKEWNRTEAEYPSERCIHELFEEQVRRTPEAAAVVYEEVTLSYEELNARANRLAHYLREQGVEPDTRVGLCVERGPEMVIGLLAVLKAGGAYVPLDPDYPSQRLGYLLSDSAPVLLLVDEAGREALAGRPAELSVVHLKADAQRWSQCPSRDLSAQEIGLRSDHLAYVIYTSGSTGEPKGVMVEHRALTHYVSWATEHYGGGKRLDSVVFSSLSFDATITCLHVPLLVGGFVKLLRRMEEMEGLEEALGATESDRLLIKITPRHLQFLGERLSDSATQCTVSLFVVGGEALSVATATLGRAMAPGATIINEYGPTETVVGCTVYDAAQCPAEVTDVPIGRPIANTRIYILDAHRRPVPVGVMGEIYIAGAGVARGYLNRPQVTAQRFVVDPFSTDPQARMYRTGDLGRYRADGNIEFLGRNDDQVKVRGYRIELGEIESQLRAHAGVREAVVVAREEEGGGKRLVGYYVPEAGEEPETESLKESLREHLKERLPEYMVPAALVRLEALPLTANGKLDHRALPAPEEEAYARAEYEEPRGEVECALAEIWQQLLEIERVGRQDNFFELGGHSLLAVTLIERMRQRGLRTDVRALFDAPTLWELARRVSREGAPVEVPESCIPVGCERITPEMLPLVELEQSEIDAVAAQVPGGTGSVQDIYPLAPLQEGILFHHLVSEQGDAYLTPTLLAFDSRERLDRFVAALQAVIERHDILRTGVMWEGLSEPVQVVWRQAPLRVEEVEVSGEDAASQLRERFDPRHYRLDVRRAPLMRVVIAHDREQGRWLLLHLAHHLALDHTTLEVVFGEVQAYLLGEEARLTAPVPFRNFVFQARRRVSVKEQEEFFRGMLKDIEEPTAPFGWVDVQGDGSGIAEARVLLEEGLSRRIRERARAAGVSAASLCHLAWGQVLSRLTGREEVVFGTVLFGRLQGGEGVEQGVGLFINTLPLRLSIGKQAVREALRGAHERLGQLLRHEHASLALAQRCSAVATPLPLFTTLLNYRYNRAPQSGAGQRRAWEGIGFLGGEERTNYPLGLSVDDLGEGFGLTAQIRAQQSPERICRLMSEALSGLVEALERAPEMPIGAVEVLPGQERERVLREWNRTEAEYPSQRCIHELFEEQVRRTPEAAAVVYEEVTLSYEELNARANRLAHYLREQGVEPDTRVGLCAERGPEMVIGVLAVLKAGGAYVPLDPDYPSQRLGYLLSDSAPVLLLVDEAGREALAGQPLEMPVVDLKADAQRWSQCPSRDLSAEEIGLRSDHLAYVIYTSGSTGEPKGVMVEHRGVCNLALAQIGAFGVEADSRVLQFASISFDACVSEVMMALCCGAALHVVGKKSALMGEALARVLEERRITHVTLPPAVLPGLGEAGQLSGVGTLICAGEALPRELARRWSAGRRLLNAYGPTEATVCASVHHCHEQEQGEPPIGRPIANTKIYILDAQRRPVPIGVAGEIYIGGVGVARGYLNRPELTAQRFEADPFSTDRQARVYRTGDLGRYRADGNIEFLGRNDDQVKVRGYRIELGEIESQLRAHAGVREAVVVAREEEGGGKRLVGYYVPEGGEEPETESVRELLKESLREHLKRRLPEYMVPAALVRLEALPLTANGKLDRRALPAPEGEAYVTGSSRSRGAR